jgi:hypothetical protein
MAFAVLHVYAAGETFLARVVNPSLWRSPLAVMGHLAGLMLGLAMKPAIFGEGPATLGEEQGLLTAVTAKLDEALATAVEETEIPAEVKMILGEELR